MGQFRVTVHAVGNHGCERDKTDGEHVVGCERPGCVDCIAREFVRRLKKSGASIDTASLEHWPGQVGTVEDNLLTGVRYGNF